MGIRNKVWALGAQLMMVSGLAGAAPFTPAQITNPPPYAWPGLALDIIGITPGQKIDAVKQALQAHFTGQKIATLSSSLKLDTVSTASFVSRIESAFPGEVEARDAVKAWFSSPASGSQVISVARWLSYSADEMAKAPRVADMQAALAKQYGQPSTVVGSVTTWTLKAGKSVACNASICTRGTSLHYASRELSQYVTELEAGPDVVIRADITPQANNNERVGAAAVTMLDIKRRGEAAKTDIDALRAEQERQQKSSPGNMPTR